MKIENSTSACLLGLLLEFNRVGGRFKPAQAETFKAMLIECIQEVEQLEVTKHPAPPTPSANDNRRVA